MSKPKVAFICVHNSCRSQIAEALGKYLAEDVFPMLLRWYRDKTQLPCKHREDWGLNNPTGKGEKEFLETIQMIHEKIQALKKRFK